jgi:F420-0:gamma-glutamyl ligase
MSRKLEVVPVHGLPEIDAGDSLGELIARGLNGAGL